MIEPTRKPCPLCGQPLIVRVNTATRSRFLGCSGWPECQHTEKYPTDLRMRDAGAPMLPGIGE